MLNTLVPKDWILLIDKGADVNEPLQVRPFLREKEASVDESLVIDKGDNANDSGKRTCSLTWETM